MKTIDKFVPLTSRMGTSREALSCWLTSSDAAALSPEGRRRLERLLLDDKPHTIYRDRQSAQRDMEVLTGNFIRLDID